jgi:hypothetical protein
VAAIESSSYARVQSSQENSAETQGSTRACCLEPPGARHGRAYTPPERATDAQSPVCPSNHAVDDYRRRRRCICHYSGRAGPDLRPPNASPQWGVLEVSGLALSATRRARRRTHVTSGASLCPETGVRAQTSTTPGIRPNRSDQSGGQALRRARRRQGLRHDDGGLHGVRAG